MLTLDTLLCIIMAADYIVFVAFLNVNLDFRAFVAKLMVPLGMLMV